VSKTKSTLGKKEGRYINVGGGKTGGRSTSITVKGEKQDPGGSPYESGTVIGNRRQKKEGSFHPANGMVGISNKSSAYERRRSDDDSIKEAGTSLRGKTNDLLSGKFRSWRRSGGVCSQRLAKKVRKERRILVKRRSGHATKNGSTISDITNVTVIPNQHREGRCLGSRQSDQTGKPLFSFAGPGGT